MFKRSLIFLIIFSLQTLFSVSVYSAESEEYDSNTVNAIVSKTNVFDLKAKSSILIDSLTGNILIENNSHERLPIASITKIMSMLLVMESINEGKISLNDIVVISEHSYSMGGSQVYLEPGEEFTVEELLKAVAIHSANDATVALAEKVAGSEDVFVVMMNKKAEELGMIDTNFLDCSGLTDEGQYSSAYDISVMARELILKYPKIIEYTSIWHDTFRNGEFSLDNTNKLIRFYEGTNGIKTGFTTKAGYCLCASVERNGLLLISVVLGEPDTNTRFAETKKLQNYGFANFDTVKLNSKNEIIKSVIVKKGLLNEVNAIYADDISLLVNKGKSDNIEREYLIHDIIEAPITEGQKIGHVIYKLDGDEIGSADVITDRAVDRTSFIKLFVRIILDWFRISRE
jgi:serine-type D-Ala-D-Ala carboxypeptidase (penicillin-binding protein 5/6)